MLVEESSLVPISIGAIQKFSTLDYPGKLSAVVFCQGCPNRCVYCHNPDFIDHALPGRVSFDDLVDFLGNRKGLLDAVVFSGGEPLIQMGIVHAIEVAKSMGFLVGIHTSGVVPPSRFNDILSAVDWVGFDIKTSFENYERITQSPSSGSFAFQNFDLLVDSGVPFEIRTTYDSRHIAYSDMLSIAKFLHQNGVDKWVIQECILRSSGGDLRLPLPSPADLSEISQFISIEIRKQ